ncbi:MAG: hypothetical protein JSR58_03495 [Verrucomicrobia bacterium]|nr:hypothetical protein [Verrucomicrobiota bacterium]
MAAITSTSSEPVFTKAFLAKNNSLSARTELVFDKSSNTLTLAQVNLWKSKEVVHLDTPLADDPELCHAKDVAELYHQACLIAVSWSRAFPLEKLKDNSYKTEDWNATVVIKVRSPEEAFLYWILYNFYPQNDMQKLDALAAQYTSPPRSHLELIRQNTPKYQAMFSKIKNGDELTPEEDAFLEQTRPLFNFVDDPKNKIESLKQMREEFKKIHYLQVLERPENVFSMADMISATNIRKKSELYASAIAKQSSKINEVD